MRAVGRRAGHRGPGGGAERAAAAAAAAAVGARRLGQPHPRGGRQGRPGRAAERRAVCGAEEGARAAPGVRARANVVQRRRWAAQTDEQRLPCLCCSGDVECLRVVGRCVGLEPLFLARGAVRREAHWITLAARCGRVPAAGSGASGGVRASCARLWQVRVLRAARAVHGPGPLVAGADAGVHERQRRLGAGPGRHRVPGEDRGRRVWRPVQGRLLRAGRGDKDPAQRAGRHAAVPGVPAGARRAAGPGFWRGGASRAAGACVPSAKACRRAAGRAAVDCG